MSETSGRMTKEKFEAAIFLILISIGVIGFIEYQRRNNWPASEAIETSIDDWQENQAANQATRASIEATAAAAPTEPIPIATPIILPTHNPSEPADCTKALKGESAFDVIQRYTKGQQLIGEFKYNFIIVNKLPVGTVDTYFNLEPITITRTPEDIEPKSVVIYMRATGEDQNVMNMVQGAAALGQTVPGDGFCFQAQ